MFLIFCCMEQVSHSMSNQHTYFTSPSQILIKFYTLKVGVKTKKNTKFKFFISNGFQNTAMQSFEKQLKIACWPTF